MLQNDTNLGFAAGCNVGMQYLLQKTFDLVLLLNNDTEIAPDCLEVLLEAAERHPAAAYGATIYEKAGRLWYGGGVLNPCTLEARHETNLISKKPHSTDFVTGCCIMIRVEALHKLGILDERFFAYYEDLDWCLRARAAGERLIYAPGAKLHHDVSHSFRRVGMRPGKSSPFAWAQSRPLVMYLSYRNRLLIAEKHASGTSHRCFLTCRIAMRGIVHAILLFSIGEWVRGRAILKGLVHGFTSAGPNIDQYIGSAISSAPDNQL